MSISAGNSTNTPLTNGSTFTGRIEDALQWTSVDVGVKTDRSGVLTIEYSVTANDVNYDITDSVAVSASVGTYLSFPVKERYFRIKFLNNSGSAQTYLRLQTILKREAQSIAIPSTINVSAADLDIRSLAWSTDSVTVSGGRSLAWSTDSVTVSGGRSLAWSTDSVTVSASSLDIRPLTAMTDTITVVGNDIDIRTLQAGVDSISIIQGGGLNVTDATYDTGSWYSTTLGASLELVGASGPLKLTSLSAYNTDPSGARILKFYNSTSGVYTDPPVGFYVVPPLTTISPPIGVPHMFSTALSVCAVRDDNTPGNDGDLLPYLRFIQ